MATGVVSPKAGTRWALTQFGITPISRTRLGIEELGRRTMAQDLSERIGQPKLEPIVVDAEVVEE